MTVLALCLNRRMSASANRLAHFRSIVETEAAAAGGTDRQRYRAAYRAIAAEAELKEEYIYQLFTGKKTKIGDEATAKLEKAYANGREPGWMDGPPSPVREDPGFEPIRPPTVEEAVYRLAELLFGLDDDGRAMASTALSNLAKNPERAAKAAETLETLTRINPREPTPTAPASAEQGSSGARARGKTKLTVKEGGGQKMQLDLPWRTVADPFDKTSASPRERAWYERVRAAPKAKGKGKP
jgi:hypothetical protein